MSNDSDGVTVSRPLTMATIVFAAAFALHGIDHLRRGMAASPMAVMIGGTIQGLFRGGRRRAGPVPTSTGFRGRHRGGVRKCGAVFICARAAHFSAELSRQLHLWTADQRHLVFVADSSGRDRDRGATRLHRSAIPAESGGRRSTCLEWSNAYVMDNSKSMQCNMIGRWAVAHREPAGLECVVYMSSLRPAISVHLEQRGRGRRPAFRFEDQRTA
jgi:hypothetical protein